MARYELSGIVKVVMPEEVVGAKGFKKRMVVVTEPDAKYPQDVAFELHGDNCALADVLRVGDGVTVHFGIRGREYNGRYYNNLVAFKLDAEGGGRGPVVEAGAGASAIPEGGITPEFNRPDAGSDDMPF